MENTFGHWQCYEKLWEGKAVNMVTTHVFKFAYNTRETVDNEGVQLLGLLLQTIKSTMSIVTNHLSDKQKKFAKINFATFDIVGKQFMNGDGEIGEYRDTVMKLEHFTLFNKNQENAKCVSEHNSEIGKRTYVKTALRKWTQLFAILNSKSKFSTRTRFFALSHKQLGTQYRFLIYASEQIDDDKTQSTWHEFINGKEELQRAEMANNTLLRASAWDHL